MSSDRTSSETHSSHALPQATQCRPTKRRHRSTVIDLCIQGGRLLDPSSKLDRVGGVAVDKGLIVGLDIDATCSAHRTIYAKGMLVVPGLIDSHAHVFPGSTFWGVDPDSMATRTGVTTWIDAGSSGAATFSRFRSQVVTQAQSGIYCLLNAASTGLLRETNEFMLSPMWSVNRTVGLIDQYRSIILGIKVRMGSNVGTRTERALLWARELAEHVRLPLMVHISSAPPTLGAVLSQLRGGDILTHTYTPHSMRLTDSGGSLMDVAHAAKERGVHFDVGHGRGSFSFAIAETLVQEDFLPDIISSDLHRLALRVLGLGAGHHEASGGITNVMTKFLWLGMSLPTIIAATTQTPAAVFGLPDDVGRLRIGGVADLTILQIEEGAFRLQDGTGQVRMASQRLKPVLAIRGGAPLGPPDLTGGRLREGEAEGGHVEF